MSSDPVIRLRDVSKHYLIYDRPEDRLKQMILPKLGRLAGRPDMRFYRDFPAASHISFDIGRGETVGIVGRNGSGKSTLLQMICGTLTPTGGSIEVHGRIAALLELGSGFNPEFTGRENVFLNASILGLSRKETEDRFDSIAAFAEIGHFMDQPVKTYSSGMYVRLAFAVAINVDPDILIIDEALSVGDEAFQRKCFARIEQIRASGATILFVSHGAQTIVQLCDRAILIDRGEKLLEGRPKTVVNHYQRLLSLGDEEVEAAREALRHVDGWAADAIAPARPAAQAEKAEESASGSAGRRDGSWFQPDLRPSSIVEYSEKGAQVDQAEILNFGSNKVNNLAFGEEYYFKYTVKFSEPMNNVNFGMFIKTKSGVELAGCHALRPDEQLTVEAGDSITVTFPFQCKILPGLYSLNCGIFTRSGEGVEIRHRILDVLLFRVFSTDFDQTRLGIVDLTPHDATVQIEKAGCSVAV